MEILFTILASIAVGLVIGWLSGLLGIGGGTILVPVFKLAYGMPAIAATATSLFTIIPTSLTGAVTHIRNGTCILALGVAAGVGGAITSPVGVWLANVSPEWAIMVAAALVIGYSAITMFRKAMKLRAKQKASCPRAEAPSDAQALKVAQAHGQSDPASKGNQREALDEFRVETPLKRQIAIGVSVGLGAGLLSGYVGVGGGFIMVPLFMQLLHTPMKLTSGTSLVAVMILAIPGTIAQAMMGNVHWLAGIFTVIGTIPGAAIGARFVKRVPELTLRFVFSAFLLVAATMLVVNQFVA